MGRRSIHRRLEAAFAATIVLVAIVLQTAAAAPGDTGACAPSGDAPAFAVASLALTGPGGGDVTVTVTGAAAGCVAPSELKLVQLKTFALDGSLAHTHNLTDVAAPGGVATIDLGNIARGQQVALEVLVQTGAPERTYVLRDRVTVKLRPDLVVASVSAPRQVLRGRTFAVETQVAERNGDVGATATLALSTGTTSIASTSIEVAAGGITTTSFDVTLTTAGTVRLDVTISGAVPPETDVTNNDGHAVVEVTDFEVEPSQVLVPTLAGYGSHFNHRIYSQLGRDVGITTDNVGALEAKMVALQPQLSRIFVNDTDLKSVDRRASFIQTVLLAQRTGTTINVTWQGGLLTVANGAIPRLAAVLNELVQDNGVTNLRWLTLQNEPNEPGLKLTPQDYEARYRALDPYIQNIRGQVRYMGGDLVRGNNLPDPTNQQIWFDYMAQHMSDILDAWSVHAFWDYWDTDKLQARLTEVRAIWDQEPPDERKPLYWTEYGVRGIKTIGTTKFVDPGVWDATQQIPLTQTNVNAFQHAWFDVLSARLGYLGTIKWDSYFGKYDNTPQAYWMIGPPQAGWPTYPIYNVVRLWTMSVRPGWKTIGVVGSSATQLLTAYTGAGDLTVIGLDTAGSQLNTSSPVQTVYSIGGLPPSTSLHLAVWNENGDGLTVPDPDVVVDHAGVAVFSVPVHAVFALTTMPIQPS